MDQWRRVALAAAVEQVALAVAAHDPNWTNHWTVWAKATECGLREGERTAFEYGWGWVAPLIGPPLDAERHPDLYAAGRVARTRFDQLRALK